LESWRETQSNIKRERGRERERQRGRETGPRQVKIMKNCQVSILIIIARSYDIKI
jgi:hypothetical protein